MAGITRRAVSSYLVIDIGASTDGAKADDVLDSLLPVDLVCSGRGVKMVQIDDSEEGCVARDGMVEALADEGCP